MKRPTKMILVTLAGLILFLLVLYAFAPHPAKIPDNINSITEMEIYFKKLVESGNPPGLTVVVVKGDKVVYLRAFGYADALNKEAASPNTVYHWWSMTKIPTAMAVMQLQERGFLNIDDDVRTYLPWFEVEYTSTDSPAITIRHLLQHSSGLPDTMPAMIGWVHYDDATRNQTEIVKKNLPAYNTLRFEPGTKAVYSNFNYMVIGALIESVSNQTYEDYIAENILQPLGMLQTGFVYSPTMTLHEASGSLPVIHFYTLLLPFLLDTNALINKREGKILWMNRVYIDATPSTGLIGSGNDTARFMVGYLTGFTSSSERILSPQSLSTMMETAPLNGHGIGWLIGTENGSRYLEHAGGGPGFATAMRLYPDDGLGIALLANGTDLDRASLVNLLVGMGW